MPTFRLERAILKANPAAVIAGIDEAGRGPWAGPVVAGAAILDPTQLPEVLVRELDDSKKLTATTRERLFDLLADPWETSPLDLNGEWAARAGLLRDASDTPAR